jgi:hypothetical protein
MIACQLACVAHESSLLQLATQCGPAIQVLLFEVLQPDFLGSAH